MLRGGLLTRFYLDDGIRLSPNYAAIKDADVVAFADRVRGLWASLEGFAKPSEAETEAEFIFPLLDALGWLYLPQQEPGKGRKDLADALLFGDAMAKDTARKLPSAERFRHGLVVVENEARDTALDRAAGKGEAPASQIMRYVVRADAASGGACRWGLLTNGRLWRLYSARARARAEGFVEFDLPALVSMLPPSSPAGARADHWLRVFLLLFGRDAHLARGAEGRTFLDDAVDEGRRYEARVTSALADAVFDTVFPRLVAALAEHDPEAKVADAAWREAAREAALRLLYRLLFVLYAEDRDLLPVMNSGYAPYSLRKMRAEAADILDHGKALSPKRVTWWASLRELFRAIAEGDASMGLPPYNGGLFNTEPDEVLGRVALPDTVLVGVVDAMGREGDLGARRWINYRDLSVQQLGTVYENLLERDVVQDGAGGVALRANAYARKTSGSYYTPPELVALVLRRAVGPLLAERREAFMAKAAALASDTRPKAERLRDLLAHDPATSFLDLRVLDPAMGSAHFLVALVDYLTDAVLAATGEAAAAVTWADYRSPLLERLEAIRAEIKANAAKGGWPVDDAQLDDRHLVRRFVLKRVVHGVDLNPMAVELAKLSLWLHSFTVGAPLSFLDHHLRCGDSLLGEFVGPWEEDLRARYGLTLASTIAAAQAAASGMALVEQAADADIAGVDASARAFAGVEQDTGPLRALLDLYHAARWLPAETPADAVARATLFDGSYGDLVAIAEGKASPRAPAAEAAPVKTKRGLVPAVDAHAAATRFVADARRLAAERRWLHWEVAFPNVWSNWTGLRPAGGFDAVVGNPPWDRIKLQTVEWFAARVPAVAKASKASDRAKAISVLRAAGDPVAAEYDRAADAAETGARVLREIGAVSPLRAAGEKKAAAVPEHVAYPTMAGGDANLYALMVERAARLVRDDGVVGVLVPSGIAADQGAAPFFRSISTTGRLGALLDFENRRTALKLDPFFPDVDSRFKFAAIAFGGRGRTFDKADCAFFQQSAAAAEADAFSLAPADFATVNPNTGTAPVFRSAKDAEIVRGIYARLPVLVDRSGASPRAAFPVRYFTMLHMTNDSAKFLREADLVKLGAYRVAHQRWEMGERRWHPLVVGRSIHQFDHRAAAVVENPANLHNPFNSKPTTDAEHADPDHVPAPQFWIEETNLDGWPAGQGWALAFRDIARPTDARTFIASAVPKAGFGNKAPLLIPDAAASGGAAFADFAPLLLGNLNSFALDYVARQKVQGTNLNWFIVEQLPVVPPAAYERRFGNKTAAEIARADVLRLTYTANDMAAFATDMGVAGQPFPWDAEDRLRRRARLDAVFFHLYGLDREQAAYVLGTFPIIREQEEAAHNGRFRSRDLILGYMAALAAGAPDAKVAG